MDLVTDKLESAKLVGEVFRIKAFPVPVFDLILDDNSFVPDVIALGQKAVGVVVGGHTGFLAFADVPTVADRRVRKALRVAGVYAYPLIGWWLRQRRAARVGAVAAGLPSWIPSL